MPEEEQAQPRQFQQYIAVGGYYPPIPGFLAPGLYNVDLDARTATPVPPEQASSTVTERIEEVAPPAQGETPPSLPVSNGG